MEKKTDMQKFFLIDLPGYGHAEVSKEMSKNWNELMGAFFAQVSESMLLLNLQDSRHPDQDADRQFYDFIKRYTRKTILVFNKIDKLKTQKERNFLEKLKPILSKEYKWIRQMYFASAHSKKGIPQIEEAIMIHFLEELEMRKVHVEDPNLAP